MLKKIRLEELIETLSNDDSKKVLEKKRSTYEGLYMYKQMQDHFAFFDSKHVKNLKNFSQPLKTYGIKKIDDRKKPIIEFVEYMKNTKNVNIFLLKKRAFKKADEGIINILYNRLALEYPDDLLLFLNHYIDQKYPQNSNSQDLISKFKSNIDSLKQESSYINITSEKNIPDNSNYISVINALVNSYKDSICHSSFENDYDDLMMHYDEYFMEIQF